MTDQAPELLPCPLCDVNTKPQHCRVPGCPHPYLVVPRPTPSERPVAQVREALPLADHDEIGRKVFSRPWVIQKAIVTIAAHCTALRDHQPTGDVADLAACISHCCNELADALTSERPSESAVARLNEVIIALGVATTQTEVEPNRRWEAHAKVLKYLEAQRHSIPHGDAVRAQTIEKCPYCAGTGIVGRRYWPDWNLIDEPCPKCASPTLASERVSERTGDKQI